MQISETQLTSRDIKFIAFALQFPVEEVPNRTAQSVFDDMMGYQISIDDYLDGRLEKILSIRTGRVLGRLEDHCEL